MGNRVIVIGKVVGNAEEGFAIVGCGVHVTGQAIGEGVGDCGEMDGK